MAILTGTADAQILPALHDVVGVAENDTLNVRTAPDVGAPAFGTLPHDARGVEVTAHDESGTWGRVNMDESAGWASLRYLKPRPAMTDNGFPVPLGCFGTEPFWSLDISDTATEFELFDISQHDFPAGDRRRATGRTDRWALTTETVGALATAIIGSATCFDGMSDRAYGLTGDVLVGDRDGIVLYSGCCTLSPP